MEHLDDVAIANLAANRLLPDERAEAMAHVERCPDCDERLQATLFGNDVATADVEEPTSGSKLVTDNAELAGTRLGRYLILDPVGKGALGIVYSAYDPELDRRIAIKVLRQSVTTSDAQQQSLRHEARSMARFSHPNVVPVFDVGIEDHRLFIAMELVDGWTLGDWVRNEERSWREIRDVYHLAGEGLVAVHEAGLVYRDFKPSNVMLGRDGRVRLLDFGIAHKMLGPSTFVPGSIGARGGLGTPGYMAPEQYSITEKVDAQADQYAFCASVYEALYGVRPFGGRTVEVVHENTVAQRWSQPQRDPGAPPWLRAAIVRGLSLERGARWPDMPSLLHAIVKDRRSRRAQAVLLLSAVLGTAVVTSVATLVLSGEVTAAERDRIEQLTLDARAAAGQSRFVYPPANDPAAATALSIVLELEHIEGDAAEPADARAQELREEIGSKLLALGDSYYDKDGGRPFAIDYYAEALLFVDDERARSRVILTPGELASLRERAHGQSFSPAELTAAESLVALAEPDAGIRHAKLVAIQQRQGPGALGARDHVARLLGETQPPRGGAVDEPGPETPAVEDPAPTASTVVEDPTAAEEPTPDERPSPTRPSSAPSDALSTRDPGKAAALAKQARDAFAGNQLETAEKLYHRALELDSRNDAALAGLSELYFERGKYRKSLEFAKKAVARAPEQGRLRILIGDAHFKVLEYAEARRHYEKARALGHPSAEKRLEKLEQTVGK